MECSVSELVDYIYCPARAFIARSAQLRPPKQIILDRMRNALHGLIVRSIGKENFNDGDIEDTVGMIFEDLNYDTIAKDRSSITETLVNLDRLIHSFEMVIRGPAIPFRAEYGKHAVMSEIDFTVTDTKRGYIYPCVVDFSHTRYDIEYNPVQYRAHLVHDFMKLEHTNTQVCILSPNSGKRFFYNAPRYAGVLRLSIEETLSMINADLYPVRISWTCVGCPWRGLCHTLAKHR